MLLGQRGPQLTLGQGEEWGMRRVHLSLLSPSGYGKALGTEVSRHLGVKLVSAQIYMAKELCPNSLTSQCQEQ
jgi:hypothetical protein